MCLMWKNKLLLTAYPFIETNKDNYSVFLILFMQHTQRFFNCMAGKEKTDFVQ